MRTFALIDSDDHVVRTMQWDGPDAPDAPLDASLTWFPVTETWPTISSSQMLGDAIYSVDRTAGGCTKSYGLIDKPLAQINVETFASAIAAGVRVTSTGTPSISGTYSIAPSAQANISAIVAGIGAGQGLPGGQATFTYLDAAGIGHIFDAAQFMAFAVAVRDHVYALTIAEAGQGAWPSAAITIL